MDLVAKLIADAIEKGAEPCVTHTSLLLSSRFHFRFGLPALKP